MVIEHNKKSFKKNKEETKFQNPISGDTHWSHGVLKAGRADGKCKAQWWELVGVSKEEHGDQRGQAE